MKFILRQRDAVWCLILPKREAQVKFIWDLLSYEGMINTRGFPEKIIRSMVNKQGGYPKFPVGLMPYVHECIRRAGHQVDVVATGSWINPILKPEIPDEFTLEDYQERVLRKMGAKRRGIIVSPTGSGKTIMMGSAIARYGVPISLIITPTKDTFGGAYRTMSGMFPDQTIGRIGEGHKKLEHITVAIWGSLVKWNLKEYNKYLEMVLIDEVHGSHKSMSTIMAQLTNAWYRWGFTATEQTPEMNKEKWMRQDGMTGPIITTVTDEEAAARVTGVDVWMVTHNDPYPTGSTYEQIYRKGWMLNHERNMLLMKMVKRAMTKDRRVMLLIDETKQGEYLYDLALQMMLKGVTFIHGKHSKEKREKAKADLNKGKINTLIATNVFGVGTNIPEADTVILGSTRKSVIQIIQKIGRGRRKTAKKGNEKLVVIDVFDNIECGRRDWFRKYSQHRKAVYEQRGWFRGFIDEA
jgi:superfamily II DNA or RNA helicase